MCLGPAHARWASEMCSNCFDSHMQNAAHAYALLIGRAFKQPMCQVMKTAREFWRWGFLLQIACISLNVLMASQQWEWKACTATEFLKMFSSYIHQVLYVLIRKAPACCAA